MKVRDADTATKAKGDVEQIVSRLRALPKATITELLAEKDVRRMNVSQSVTTLVEKLLGQDDVREVLGTALTNVKNMLEPE